MSTRRLRYFVRLDGRGNIVPGSLVARRKGQGHPGRPGTHAVTGSWMEITNPKCCPDTVVTVTPTGTPSGTSTVTVVGSCDGTQLFTYSATSASIADTVSKLNTNFPAIATWAVVGSTITATSPICPDFTFTVAYAG